MYFEHSPLITVSRRGSNVVPTIATACSSRSPDCRSTVCFHLRFSFCSRLSRCTFEIKSSIYSVNQSQPAMALQRANTRLKRELLRMTENPPEGISCYPKDDKMNILLVNIVGPHDSPYEGGLFQLELEVDNSYPFEPPRLKFITPVYHPNVDTSGRICMDLLKMPTKGGWKPTITLENLLVAAKLLLGNPNPDDPLMPEIATEYRFNRTVFEKKAKVHTQQYAKRLD